MTIYKSARILILLVLVLLAFSCKGPKKFSDEELSHGRKSHGQILDKILDEHKLTATTIYNSIDYFVYRGEPMGYQYEMLQAFADYLGVKLEVKIINDLDKSIECVKNKNCDLIAVGLTVTKDRLSNVDFTVPIGQTRQMLVQRKSGYKNSELIRNPIDLAGKTVYIEKGSTYENRLHALSDEIGAEIGIAVDKDATVEELIEMVSKGEINYTISDENVALVNEKYYTNIDVSTPISFPQNLAWAVNKQAIGLRDTLNYWLKGFLKTAYSANLYNKYFKNPRSIEFAKGEFGTMGGDQISPFDKIIKKYSKLIGWDWRLLASLIYQESRFYPEAQSWAGAFGLMQLMPHTAEKYGIDSLSSPDDQIKAGVEFIHQLDKQFVNHITEKNERIKFVLASYNAGIAHVYDARRLAEKYDKNPNQWNDNVDYFLLNESKPEYYQDSVVKYGYCRGQETYAFVNDVLNRYQHYRNVFN